MKTDKEMYIETLKSMGVADVTIDSDGKCTSLTRHSYCTINYHDVEFGFKVWKSQIKTLHNNGYVVTPIEPTERMIRAGEISHSGYDDIDAQGIYKEMLKHKVHFKTIRVSITDQQKKSDILLEMARLGYTPPTNLEDDGDMVWGMSLGLCSILYTNEPQNISLDDLRGMVQEDVVY